MHWMEAVAINMNGWHHVVVVGREQVIQCVCPRLILLFHTEEHHPQSTDYDYYYYYCYRRYGSQRLY